MSLESLKEPFFWQTIYLDAKSKRKSQVQVITLDLDNFSFSFSDQEISFLEQPLVDSNIDICFYLEQNPAAIATIVTFSKDNGKKLSSTLIVNGEMDQFVGALLGDYSKIMEELEVNG